MKPKPPLRIRKLEAIAERGRRAKALAQSVRDGQALPAERDELLALVAEQQDALEELVRLLLERTRDASIRKAIRRGL